MNNKKKYIFHRVMIVFIFLILIIGIITSMYLFKKQISFIAAAKGSGYTAYDKHYVLISNKYDEAMYQEIYKGAYEHGKEKGVLVEWLGQNLDINYSDEELLKIGLDDGIDGIILVGEDTENIRTLIADAEKRNIPIVTVLNDCYGSERQSYVGISSYNLGREYGREIIKTATKESRGVVILTDSSIDSNIQSVVLNGIKETLNNEGNHLQLNLSMVEINNTGAFSADQQIRQMLKNMETYPDYVVALTQSNTNSIYQAVIDMNIVGQMEILGFYTSKNILQEVENNVLDATVFVDFYKMGATSVEALNEYLETGFVSDFFLIDADIVNKLNVEEYLKDERN